MPRGPKPKPAALARAGSRTHEYRPAPGVGWQHGSTPPAPGGLSPETVAAWDVWFSSWMASFWMPSDLPGLEALAGVYERVRFDGLDPVKLLPYLDRYGLTAKGRQDNRWAEPVSDKAEPEAAPGSADDLSARREARAKLA